MPQLIYRINLKCKEPVSGWYCGESMIKVLVFGTGYYLGEILEKIEEKYDIIAFLDNQIKKQNSYMEKGRHRYWVMSPNEVKSITFDKVIIASIEYASEMFTQLLQLGVKEHDIIVDFVSVTQNVYVSDFIKMQTNHFYEENRLDIVVKYLAIENYYGKNDYGYRLYQTMQMARLKYNNLEAENALVRFQDLIRSFEANGFDRDSYIICDEQMKIMDGAHRTACALYFNLPFIQVKIVPRRFECEFGKQWFWENQFKVEDIDKINDKYTELVQDREGMIAVLWPSVSGYFEEITRELSRLIDIEQVVDQSFSDRSEFEDAVWKIYSVDDIADWKVQKKIEYMRKYGTQIRFIQFRLAKPYYRLKVNTHLPLSMRLEGVKKIIRQRFEGKVNPYFFDIIIHIADNYSQSNQINGRLNLNIFRTEEGK